MYLAASIYLLPKRGSGGLGYLVGRRDSKVADFLRNLLLDCTPPLTVLKNYSFRSNADSMGRNIDILREDLSLSVESAEHKTQLLVGQKICQQPPESIGSWAFWKKDNQQLGM